MKNRSFLLAAAALFVLPSTYAIADNSGDVDGFVELGVRGVDDQDDSAKFQE